LFTELLKVYRQKCTTKSKNIQLKCSEVLYKRTNKLKSGKNGKDDVEGQNLTMIGSPNLAGFNNFKIASQKDNYSQWLNRNIISHNFNSNKNA
jgi:hypothetical protein